MNDEQDIDFVWQAYQKEKQSNKLQIIPKTFYTEVSNILQKNIQEETKDNINKTVSNLIKKRKQKILIYVALDEKLPSALPDSEVQFYNQIKSFFDAEDLNLKNKQNPDIIVKQDIPKIILPSGKEIGPLANGQLITITDEEDKKFLLINNICGTT